MTSNPPPPSAQTINKESIIIDFSLRREVFFVVIGAIVGAIAMVVPKTFFEVQMGLPYYLTWIVFGRIAATDLSVTTFDSLQQQEQVPGGFLTEGRTFEFTFTKVGEYLYHCEPHPWMKGKVNIVENFA